MTDVTIQLSEVAATELAAALQVPAPEPAVTTYDEIVIEVVSGVVTVRRQDGFASVARVSAGVFDFTLSQEMPDLFYAPVCAGRAGSGVPAFRCEAPISKTVFRVTCWNNSTVTDPNYLSVKMFR